MKKVEISLLPISSPTCQVLIQEQLALQNNTKCQDFLVKCKELLVIRVEQSLVAYGTFDLYDGQIMRVNSLHFRDILSNHVVAQYWLSRYVKRKLEKQCYFNFLIAS